MRHQTSAPNTTTRRTRWGDVEITSQRLTEHRTRLTYVGGRDAVFVEVGRSVGNTTQQYEHMFCVESVQLLVDGRMKVECQRNTYAGD
jgi:hypothetical protein